MYKTSDQEEEYFKKQEFEKLRRQRQERAAGLEVEERTRLKQLHWMRCPKCGMELAEVDFHGVMVDTCFSCGGMYLDKGEIDKLAAKDDPGWLGGLLRNLVG